MPIEEIGGSDISPEGDFGVDHNTAESAMLLIQPPKLEDALETATVMFEDSVSKYSTATTLLNSFLLKQKTKLKEIRVEILDKPGLTNSTYGNAREVIKCLLYEVSTFQGFCLGKMDNGKDVQRLLGDNSIRYIELLEILD